MRQHDSMVQMHLRLEEPDGQEMFYITIVPPENEPDRESLNSSELKEQVVNRLDELNKEIEGSLQTYVWGNPSYALSEPLLQSLAKVAAMAHAPFIAAAAPDFGRKRASYWGLLLVLQWASTNFSKRA